MSQTKEPTQLQNEKVKYERLTSCAEITDKSSLKIGIPDIKQFTALIDSVRFMCEGNILLSERGLEIRGYPPNKTQFIDLYIPADDFTEFECNQPMKLGIQYDALHTALKRVRADDIVTLEFEIMGATAYLQVKCENEQSRKTFGVTLSDIGLVDIISTDEIPSEVSFFLESQTLKEIIADSTGYVERLVFNVSEKGLSVNGATSDNSTPYKCVIDANQLIRFAYKTPVHVQFDWGNLSQLITPLLSDVLVKVRLGSNNPMILEYVIYETGNCLKIIAPRVF